MCSSADGLASAPWQSANMGAKLGVACITREQREAAAAASDRDRTQQGGEVQSSKGMRGYR